MNARRRRPDRAAWVVAVSLALIAAACGQDRDEEPVDATVEAVCKAWCEQQEECYPDVFQESYTSMHQCRDTCEQGATDFYDGYQKPECVDEALLEDLCVASLGCQQLAEMNYESCQDEFDALQECLGHSDGGI
jgi:hypothetical protein